MSMTRRNSLRLFSSSVQPWLICIVGMLFYCYNYFLRVSPGVMEQQLAETFHMTAAKFGALAGLYYWAYMPMQLPAGLLFDRFGSRIVLSTACLTTVVGLSLFVTAESFMIAGGGRFLIGLGTAFSYIGVLKLASLWLPPRRFATVAGLTTATGMTCAALSQKYLTTIVETQGFRHALHTSVTAGVVLIMLIVFIIRSRPKNQAAHTSQSTEASAPPEGLMETLRSLASNPQMWLIGIIGCLLYLPASVFLDLWGIPWLKAVYHLQPTDAVNISSITFFGWIISGPMIGMLSDKIGRRKLPLVIFGGIAATMLCVIFYMPGLTLHTLYFLFFITGFCCGSHPLCFALSKEINSPQIAGTAIAASNMLIMSGGAIFQPLVGRLLDWHATAHSGITGGLSVYSAGDYTFALSVIPLGVVFGIFLSLFIREQRLE